MILWGIPKFNGMYSNSSELGIRESIDNVGINIVPNYPFLFCEYSCMKIELFVCENCFLVCGGKMETRMRNCIYCKPVKMVIYLWVCE